MANRSTGLFGSGSRDSQKSQKIFVPRSDFQESDYHPTLSGSFRAIKDGRNHGNPAVVSTSGVRVEKNGEWVNKDASKGSFVVYLPHDDAVAAGLGPDEGGLDPVESQRVVDLLNRELSRLLKLQSKDFWREVVSDASLHTFLESFLKFRSRWYDFPHRRGKEKIAGVLVGETELCRRVFMVFYRLSSNLDPGAKPSDALKLKDHGVLLQDLKLLDLPKLLDICAIYGHENQDLTKKLVSNAINSQPHIHDEFPNLISHFLNIVQTMNQRCNSRLEVLNSSVGVQDQGFINLHHDCLEVMDFINDSVVSLDSFIDAYKLAAVSFSFPVETSYGNEELLTTLAMLHDSFLPSLGRGFHLIGGVVQEKERDVGFLRDSFGCLKLLSTRLVNLGWKLLHSCYLSDEAFGSGYSPSPSAKMFPASIEDPFVRADIVNQTIRTLSGNTAPASSAHWDSASFIQAIEENHKIMARIKYLMETGWLVMDDDQYHFLSAILLSQEQADLGTPNSFGTPENSSQMDEDAAIVESKISQIKELFPDYGRGFLLACLEAYNQDSEEVIQRILEGTLHEELKRIEVSSETVPPKSTSMVSKRGKGKEKLEDTVALPSASASAIKDEPALPSASSLPSMGRFIRKTGNESSQYEILNDKNDKEIAKTAALATQLEYEDEYDDSFDELGLSVGDAGLEEPLSRAEDESEGNWSSQKKPQFYVKDGKNYSYKVEGSIAVSNLNQAKLVNRAQKELIYGFGPGADISQGAVNRYIDSKYKLSDEQQTNEAVQQGGRGAGRGRGRRGSEEQEQEGGERGGRGNYRGGGRRGRGRSHYRRDKTMSKHLSGLPGHYS